MKMRMQQRDNETREEGEGEERTDEFTVLSLGNRFREMPMDHGLTDLILVIWVSNIDKCREAGPISATANNALTRPCRSTFP